MDDLKNLQSKLGYRFQNSDLLNIALVHKSFGNEARSSSKFSGDNERLEFLGDAILDLSVSEYLFERYPAASEGELSRWRASLVNEKILAQVARRLDLGKWIRLGKGEAQTGGGDKDSILSGTFEAILAAIFLDSDHETTRQWCWDVFKEDLEKVQKVSVARDYKTILQELVQAKLRSSPKYELVKSLGPDHEKIFDVQLWIGDQAVAKASGKSKKEAEQNCAKLALEQDVAKIISAKPRSKK